MRRRAPLLPSQLAAQERGFGVRIRYAGDRRIVGKGRKALELTAPSAGHGGRQVRRKIAKEHKWRGGGKLFSHEQHGHLRRKQEAGIGGGQQPRISECRNSVPKRPVAN